MHDRSQQYSSSATLVKLITELEAAAAQLSIAVACEQPARISSAWKRLDRHISTHIVPLRYNDMRVDSTANAPSALLKCLSTCWGYPQQYQQEGVVMKLMMVAAEACGFTTEQISNHAQMQLVQQFLRAGNFLIALPASLKHESVLLRQLCTLQSTERQKDAQSAYCGTLMMLFHAINSAWPGTAGILSARSHQHIILAAVNLAAALLVGVAPAPAADEMRTQPDIAQPTLVRQDAAKEAVRAVNLITKQLHSRLQQAAEGGAAQQLLESPVLLRMVLLLLYMQLQTSSRCSSTVAATHLQQFHQKVLQSFGNLPQQCWASGQDLVAQQQLSIYNIIQLLLSLLRTSGKRSATAETNLGELRAHRIEVCSQSSPLILVLVDLALSKCGSDIQEHIDTAVAAVNAAASAAHAWRSSLDLDLEPKNCIPNLVKGYETLQYSNCQRAVDILRALAAALQQLLLLTPAAAVAAAGRPHNQGQANSRCSSNTAAH